jgi:hypothetical protein
MSPPELRALADKMERNFPLKQLGQSTFIDFLAYQKDYVVNLHADQVYFTNLGRKGGWESSERS